SAESVAEGLSVDRIITLKQAAGSFLVKETIQNTGYLGRLYNMVQHPTLAAPFLDESTRIYCNADTGFNNIFNKQPQSFSSAWPLSLCDSNRYIDLSKPIEPYDSYFAVIVRPSDRYGSVVAWSRACRLAFGYLWLGRHYP